MAESRRQKISRRATRLVASRLGLRSLCAWLHDAHGSRLRRRSTHLGRRDIGETWGDVGRYGEIWGDMGSRLRRRSTHVGAGWRESASKYSTWLALGLGLGFGFGFGFGLGLGFGFEG